MSGGLPRDVLVVCGLQVEARIAQAPGVRTIAGGGHGAALAAAIEREIAAGVAGIVSFGVAGALDAALRPGTLIVAKSTIFGRTTFACDPEWSAALVGVLPNALFAHLAGSDRIVATRAEKESLHRETGAAAVDMESHIAARAAAAHGLPFVALRSITDPLERSLPPAATIAMREGGGIDLGAVMRSIVRAPGQWPALIGIARDMQAGLAALRAARRLAGSRLAFAAKPV